MNDTTKATNTTAPANNATDVYLTVRARVFSGRIETVRVAVDREDGTVRVWDDVAGHYTLCHSLSESAERRIRKLAGI